MSDLRRLEGERVFCHQCNNEWDRARGGLQCPRCEGEFVEIVGNTASSAGTLTDGDQLSGDRSAQEDDGDDNTRPRSPSSSRSPFDPAPRPLHDRSRSNLNNAFDNHNPWADVPDPDEGDISTYEFHTPLGGRTTFSFTSRTFTSPPPGGRNHAGPQMFPFGPMAAFGSMNARGGTFGANTGRAQPGDMQDFFQAIFSSFNDARMQGPNGQRGAGGVFVDGNAGAAPNPFDLLSAILNPDARNARSGDVVWSQEAFDQILEQLAQQGSNAPPPASEAAISALPKKKIDREMLGEDGKAECSICMENVEIGTEVTTLPCNHWFHKDCVVAWLKEHDTCPHCRKPISHSNEGHDQRQGPRTRSSRRPSSVASPFGGQHDDSWTSQRPTPDSPSAVREARNRYYGNRSAGPGSPLVMRRSASPVRSAEPEQYYGGRHESTEYHSGRPDTTRPDNVRRPSTQESTRGGSAAGGGGGVTGWIRDHLPGSGGR